MRPTLAATVVLLLACCSVSAARNLTDIHARSLKASPYFYPVGGRGGWDNRLYSTADLYMIHVNLMSDGKVVGWSTVSGKYGFGTALCDPMKRNYATGDPKCQRILGKDGISAGKNVFCSGQVTTADSEIIMFGGHSTDIEWLRHFKYNGGKNMQVTKKALPSGRWYPGAATLPDGKVIMVAGVAKSGCANYVVGANCKTASNPTFAIYDPKTGQLGSDKMGMSAQLSEAFPMSTYPHVIVTPDGNLAVAAKSSLVKYNRLGDGTAQGTRFQQAWQWPNRPGAAWVYPQTGQGILMPMSPPYNNMVLLSAGGSTANNAGFTNPAENRAWAISLTEPNSQWVPLGVMPQPRVMGDALYMCNGDILFLNGGHQGVAGWSSQKVTYKFVDGTSYTCPSARCSKADRDGKFLNLEPMIYNTETFQWSAKGSLASAIKPRLYHSSAILLPNCQVMVSGSDVTADTTAEFFSPPSLALPGRPTITRVGQFPLNKPRIVVGDRIVVEFQTTSPIQRALLIRTGASTHSMPFDARALWLPIVDRVANGLVLQLPATPNVLVPGMYMVVVTTADRNVHSNAHIISVHLN